MGKLCLGLWNPLPPAFGEQTVERGQVGLCHLEGSGLSSRVPPNSRAIGSLLPEDKSEIWGFLWNLGGDWRWWDMRGMN